MALDLIFESRNKFIIFLDSLSVFESLKNRKFDHPLIIRTLCKLKNFSNDYDMLICLVPSHTGISGNDHVDKAARSTINLTSEKKFEIPYTDFKMKINKYTPQQRQQCWNNNENNKLLEIKPTLGEWKQCLKKAKKGNYIVNTVYRSYTVEGKQQSMCYECQTKYTVKHILIEYTDLAQNRKTLVEGKQQSMCYECQTKYTVKHILIEYTDLAQNRKTFYSTNNMKELLKNTEIIMWYHF